MRWLRQLKNKPVPRMVLQWHLTDRCNLNCSHCYQETPPREELPLVDCLWILDQFQDLIRARSQELGEPMRGQITLTGGEPFLREDFPDLLHAIAAANTWTDFSILSNGSRIDAQVARHLAALNPVYVQLSMEGKETTHDRIRGRGSFQQTVAAIKNLRRAKIHTVISFTAHRSNDQEFGEVVDWACDLGVDKVWADRLVPVGRGADIAVLSPEETRSFFKIMQRARARANNRLFGRTQVVMGRALQFLEGGGQPYSCSAGRTLLTVMPDGTLVPCRRMPIPVGNVMETSLSELYFQQPLLQALRDPTRIPAGCAPCSYKERCGGGLRCLAYSRTGDPFTRDPGCYAVLTEAGKKSIQSD